MKKTHVITALIAVLSSVLTIVVFKVNESPKTIIKTEHVESAPISQVLYSKNTDGNFEALSFTDVAAKVTDAVVHIKSTSTSYARRNPQSRNPFEELFGNRNPFGPMNPRELDLPRSMGSGSGVIITTDGYIVTNNHVIDEADELEVVLNDNRTYKAEVIGTDPSTDLALIKINEEDLTTIGFGNSDAVKPGEWVMAVGNPFDLTSTVTAGIVSATGRNINILKDRYAIESFIQTDAAINPGNSGGALVNLKGDLVGINTAISSPTGAYSGYGFAVPSNLVSKVIKDLKDYGTVQRGVLGVLIRNVDGTLAKAQNLDITYGVYVDSLTENSAAAAAGLKTNDIIIAVDGKQTESSPKLQEAIANKRPGEKVSVTVNRAGTEKTIEVVLRNRNGNTNIVKEEKTFADATLGVELETIDKSLAEKLDIAGGVQITAVRSGKLLEETTVREGFVITKVDGRRIRSLKDLEKALKNKSVGVMLEGKYPEDDTVYYYAFGM
jgi:Do/DeqQ family serine protease